MPKIYTMQTKVKLNSFVNNFKYLHFVIGKVSSFQKLYKLNFLFNLVIFLILYIHNKSFLLYYVSFFILRHRNISRNTQRTKKCYAALLDRLVDEIRKKWPHLKKEKIRFHDDNAPSQTSNIAQAKKHELGFESLPHPPYSPNLAPSDYYLFPNLKRWLCGRRLESDEEVEWETGGYFRGFDKSYHF